MKEWTVESILNIIENNGDTSQVDFFGNNILIYAITYFSSDLVKRILSHSIDVNHGNDRGGTALMRACGNGKMDIVKMLLLSGADVNIRSKNGSTALGFAVYSSSCDESIALVLIEAGADINSIFKETEHMYDLLMEKPKIINYIENHLHILHEDKLKTWKKIRMKSLFN